MDYAIDSHKLMYHPQRVANLLDAGRDWERHKKLQPIYAEISTSGACNHRCTFCSVDYIGYKSVFLSEEVLERLIDGCASIGIRSLMFAGDGEPFLNPSISNVVDYAFRRSIDISFTTNAVHIRRDFIDKHLHKVSWIKASINAGSNEVYQLIHRTNSDDFDKVWSNLEYATKARGKSHGTIRTAIGAQALILPDNLHTLDELIERSKAVGLDYVVLKPYVHNVYMNQPGYRDIDYTQKLYKDTISNLKEKYDTEFFTVVSRFNALEKLIGGQERYSKCWSTPALWFYVSGNGDVYACGAHVGNENFLLGNINQSSINDIWVSSARKKCLEYVQDELNLDSCRRTCRMDETNKYLSNLFEGDLEHVNFI